ncbi:MAG: altronate dehydratase, partial [Dehalococcoidia bacterium]
MNFTGYARPDGSAGIRNHVLVIPGGFLAAKICDFVDGTKTILTADTGSGRTS